LQIADPNERRRLALAEIDKAPFGWCEYNFYMKMMTDKIQTMSEP
jgi:hypothetical protein